MLLLPGHGTTAVPDGDAHTYPAGKGMSVSYACGYSCPEDYPTEPEFGRFAYFFPDGDGIPVSADTTRHLDDLADAMVQAPQDEIENSSIPPVFTYFGQFIDHDITANTDRETGFSIIDTQVVTPVARGEVSKKLQNLRAGTLNLDSVHGGGPVQGPLAKKLDEALRFPADRSKLWAGKVSPGPIGTVPFPADPDDEARDLLRVSRLIEGNGSPLSEADLRALPDDLRKMFIKEDDSLNLQRAIIGDMRNDENLAVAQFHLAVIRLHNRIIDHAHEHPDAPNGDADALFNWGRKMTSWHYQWLVANAYLPAICDADTLVDVMEAGPRVYNDFLDKNRPSDPSLLPLPLEFSVAGFRFGHTMVRDAYDWNRFFGRPHGDPVLDQADFPLLFQFTGNGGMRGAPSLPDHWPIEWDRFVHPPTADAPDRSARRIDTNIAIPLGAMVNENPGINGRMAHLASRNLRRGLRLNLPSAQACLQKLRDTYSISLPELSEAQLTSGTTGDAIRTGNFVEHTPLWFYILKEAEELGKNGQLGPLGSRIVADTLMGLIANDPQSYWNATARPGDWHPNDGVKPDGVVIDSVAKMMEATRLL
ncbi:peroxidase family protein [Litoreibacter roseus]|uniref:Animal haem peroxidase n=1 Tax=Litoreibacter roseus TaxID=2601869 RepID=A0A6N6JEF1_9RHOB|nr:heme peroxidase family protein [Litoreibacter roseus]GFE63668.1 hypothetical protein KIN_07420 [Litoreibacter roseus]